MNSWLDDFVWLPIQEKFKNKNKKEVKTSKRDTFPLDRLFFNVLYYKTQDELKLKHRRCFDYLIANKMLHIFYDCDKNIDIKIYNKQLVDNVKEAIFLINNKNA